MTKNQQKSIISKYNSELLPPYDKIYKTFGYDTIERLVEEFGGTNLYVPTAKRLYSGCYAKQVRSEFDGYNYKELSKKYGYSERTIRNMLNS